MKIKSKNNGITLIALIITIIVMLILVGVSISMVVNGGLFEYAGKAVGDTGNAKKKEEEIATGGIEVDGVWYASPEDVANNKPTIRTYEETGKENGVLKANAYWIERDNEGNETARAVIPKGFAVVAGINGSKKISEGLVITDEVDEDGESIGNEFVWIPVKEKLDNPYVSSSNYSEPTALEGTYSSSGAAYDHQTTLTYLYRDKFNYENDFKYAKEYEEMVDQVYEYSGFYIGRYETTIDENGNIGSKYNTKVLTAGDQFEYKDTSYYYRWYGLYYFQKNANVTGNGKTVQTAMIYGQLWDKAMEFIRTNDTNYNVDSYTREWHQGSSVVNSGQANKTTVEVNGAIGDVALNIWDLEANAWEWTQEAYSTGYRVCRGGSFSSSIYASYRSYYRPTGYGTSYSSRLALYIK